MQMQQQLLLQRSGYAALSKAVTWRNLQLQTLAALVRLTATAAQA
jgi:hypothetical protein